MSLRLGVDLDGTVADFSSMYKAVEAQLFGERTDGVVDESENESESAATATAEPVTDRERLKQAKEASRRAKHVWRVIQETPDFWMSLAPLEDGAVALLHDTARRLGWEVFFITQRPKSAGASVQRQTQQWLVEQGFEFPSVLTLRGPRGKAAHALDLDFLLDDLAQNCVDVIADSKCRPLLVLRDPDDVAEATARQLKIGVVRSLGQAMDLLSLPTPAPRETMVNRVLKSLGLG